jgi:hypothetical protein
MRFPVGLGASFALAALAGSVSALYQLLFDIIETPTAFPATNKSRINRAPSPQVDKPVETEIDSARITASAFDESISLAISHPPKAILTYLLISHCIVQRCRKIYLEIC